MAVSSMIRKAYSSSVVSITLRAIESSSATPKGTILATGLRRHGSVNQSHNFCSLTTAKDLVDRSLYKALKNQIKYAKSDLKNQAIMPPESFPFEIEEDIDPSSRVLRLTRKFLDQDILVLIDASNLNIEEEIESNDEFSSSDDSSEDDNDISCDKKRDRNEKGSNKDNGGSKSKTDREVDYDDRAVAAIPMNVTIYKVGGDKSNLSFDITFSTEDIVIDSFDIYYRDKDYAINLEGPKFKEMNFELQQSLYRYLEIRGIKVNMARFLLKYIAQKKKKADLVALKHIKNVIKH